MDPCPVDDLGAASNAQATRSFLEFYDGSVKGVLGYFVRATGGNQRVAEDLCQETFFAAARAVREPTFVLSMPWLMTVARHKLADHYRKVHRDNRNLRLAWSERPWNEHAPAVDEIDSDDVRIVLSRLSDEHRILLFMRYFEDRTVPEIANLLDSSVRAIESALVRARRAVAQSYAEVRHG